MTAIPPKRHAAAELERWTIGALLDSDGPVLRWDLRSMLAASGLAGEDYTAPDCAAYFGAIRALGERGRPADAQTVFAACRGLGGVPDGALRALGALQGANQANRQAFLAHAEELRRLSNLRRLEEFHREQLAALTAERPDPAALAGALETFTAGFSGATQADETGQDDVADIVENWAAVTSGKRPPYYPTGIEALDAEIRGLVNNLNVLGGLPSIGKTALAAAIVIAALERDEKVGVFGLEDGTITIAERYIAREMGIQLEEVGAIRLNDFQEEKLAGVLGRWHHMARNLIVYRRGSIDAADMVQTAKRWVMQHRVKLVVVDHVGEVRHEVTVKDRHDVAVGNSFRALRDLAIRFKVPVLALAHFNRETAKTGSGKPTMQSFKNASGIEEMGRLLMGLWESDGKFASDVRLTVLKRTKGRRGATIWLPRDVSSGLVCTRGGGPLDLDAERDAEKAKAPSWRQS